jgi:hypothetical protein
MTLVFIIDQINFLKGSDFQFLIGLLGFNKCIISASANNLQEFDPKLTINRNLIHPFNPQIKFSANEFKSFIQILRHYEELKKIAQNPELDFDEDDINYIKSLTGAIPMELFHFVTKLTINGTLTKWIELYTSDFNYNRYQ